MKHNNRKHKIFVTDAVVKIFDQDFTAIEQIATQGATGLAAGDAVAWTMQHDNGQTMKIAIERWQRDKLVVSLDDDPDRAVNCLKCLKAGRLTPASTH